MTEQCERLYMAVLSLAHAVHKISWFRRIHSLSALGTLKNVKETLKEDKVRKIFEEDTLSNLIPKKFNELLKFIVKLQAPCREEENKSTFLSNQDRW